MQDNCELAGRIDAHIAAIACVRARCEIPATHIKYYVGITFQHILEFRHLRVLLWVVIGAPLEVH